VGTRAAPSSASPSLGGGSASSSARSTASRRTLSTTQIVVGLTLVGAVLRFATLDVQSIWLDESATLLLVHRGFGGMLSHLASSESTPPLYYVLVWGWTKIVGAGPLGFRSFSALAGTLTIPVLYAAGRQISPRAGVWAGVLAVVDPAMYYYSQEARAYALLILFAGLSFLLWQRALREPSTRNLAYWSGASALAVLTHYFAAFLFLPEAILLIRRLEWRTVRAPIGAVILTGLALSPLAIRQRSDGKASWIEGSSLVSRVGETGKQFLVGLYGPVEILTAALSALLVAGALVLLVRRGSTRERSVALDAAIVAAAGLGLPLLLAAGHVIDIFDGRNVIAAWGPYAVVLAAGLSVARAPRLGMVLGVGVVLVSLAVIVGTNLKGGYQRDDWRGAAHALGSGGRDRVIVGEQFASLPLSIYMHALGVPSGARLAVTEVDFVALRERRTSGSPAAPKLPARAPAGFALAGVERSESYAVARYVAPRPQTVTTRELAELSGDFKPDIIVQR
jgi:hypothetical protein